MQLNERGKSHSDDESEHLEPETDEELMLVRSPSGAAVHRLDELQQEQCDDEEDESDGQATTATRNVRIKYESRCSISWGRVICDEAQQVKTIRTRMHQSIALLKRHSLWFLTATPMRNKVIDICGYLTMLVGGGGLVFVDGMPQDVPMPPGEPPHQMTHGSTGIDDDLRYIHCPP